jgi:hypothetical protein
MENADTSSHQPRPLYCFMVTAGQRLFPFIIPATQETRFLTVAAKARKNRALF